MYAACKAQQHLRVAAIFMQAHTGTRKGLADADTTLPKTTDDFGKPDPRLRRTADSIKKLTADPRQDPSRSPRYQETR